MVLFSTFSLSAINTIGADIFLDSFENSECYFLIKKDNKQTIIQISDAPGFTIEPSDTLLYYGKDGEIEYGEVSQIKAVSGIKKYHIYNSEEQTITEQRVVGKIVKETDDGFLNSISMSLWDISIHTLNIRALVSD